jgi:hypothetical protein
MGFLDKAKKLAEQAQTKLDEAQKQFNTGQSGSQSSGAPVEYDQHGRPIPREDAPPASTAPPPSAAPAPPHGDPLAGSPGATTPGAPPTETSPPAPPPAAETDPSAPAPPHGDPLTVDAEREATPKAPPPPAPPEASSLGAPQGEPEDPNHPSHKPPGLSSGDPLAP